LAAVFDPGSERADTREHVGARIGKGAASESIEYSAARGAAHRRQTGGVAQQRSQGVSQRSGIARWHDAPGLVLDDGIRELADSRGDDRKRGLHRFMRGDAQPFRA